MQRKDVFCCNVEYFIPISRTATWASAMFISSFTSTYLVVGCLLVLLRWTRYSSLVGTAQRTWWHHGSWSVYRALWCCPMKSLAASWSMGCPSDSLCPTPKSHGHTNEKHLHIHSLGKNHLIFPGVVKVFLLKNISGQFLANKNRLTGDFFLTNKTVTYSKNCQHSMF